MSRHDDWIEALRARLEADGLRIARTTSNGAAGSVVIYDSISDRELEYGIPLDTEPGPSAVERADFDARMILDSFKGIRYAVTRDEEDEP